MRHIFIHCNQETEAEISNDGIEWKNTSNEELEHTLKTFKKNKDVAIIYSRENPLIEPTKHAMEAFKIVVHVKLPIKLVRQKGSDGSGESEPDGEASYANCLLVTLAKSPGTMAMLQSGYGVPSLLEINNNQKELLWILGLPFNYQKLNGDLVIHTLLKIPSKPSSDMPDKSQIFNARMVLSDGKSDTVYFEIKQVDQKGIRHFEVKRITI